MKVTLEVADALWQDVCDLAEREGKTVASLVDQGLRHVVATRREPDKPFKLRDASVGDGGLTPEFENATPETWREAMYGDRG